MKSLTRPVDTFTESRKPSPSSYAPKSRSSARRLATASRPAYGRARKEACGVTTPLVNAEGGGRGSPSVVCVRSVLDAYPSTCMPSASTPYSW